MAKVKTQFVCTECGFDTIRWLGQCPTCKSWNSFKEFKASSKSFPNDSSSPISNQEKTIALDAVQVSKTSRISTLDGELDQILGGGIVPGAVILLGGEPGIGKSTLLLQMLLRLDRPVLYVSAEESPEQIKLRANRMAIASDQVLISSSIEVSHILSTIETHNPQLVVIDSIQTVYSEQVENAQGSVSQLKACTVAFQRFAKETGIPVIIIGHITKEGQIAGPKLLEHIVDVVLQFEGDKMNQYRILRGIKNRFGPTDEIGLYNMTNLGLQVVDNPSQILLSHSNDNLPGCAVAISMEGRRPLLIEIQALVSPTIYSTPQRSTTGFDTRRLNMLLAVLEKRLGLPFINNDVFLNLVGGVKIGDPALDLAVIAALISSQLDKPISKKTAFCGEIGLTGEIRAVTNVDKRINEARKLGFDSIVVSDFNLQELNTKPKEVISVARVTGLYQELFA